MLHFFTIHAPASSSFCSFLLNASTTITVHFVGLMCEYSLLIGPLPSVLSSIPVRAEHFNIDQDSNRFVFS